MNFIKLLVILICTHCTFVVVGQHIENISMELNEDNITISYDLIDNDEGTNTFDLQLFASHDGFASPLRLVSGDIGIEVDPGSSKTIAWEAKKEIGEFKGQLFIEIRGVVTPPFLTIVSPTNGSKFKPGKTAEVRWVSNTDEDIDISLFKGKAKISTITQGTNEAIMNWTIPKSIEKGIYQLQFSRSGNTAKTISSSEFVIAKGRPIWVIIAGVAVVGGVTGIVLVEKPTETPGDNEIPDPIKPSN